MIRLWSSRGSARAGIGVPKRDTPRRAATRQASAIGTAITLTFSALSGTFVPRGALPNWLQGLSLVTPNAWGNEWYYRLINGASLNEVLPAVLVLLAMATVLFAIASIAFRRMYR